MSAITDGLENKGVSQVTYFVEILLITSIVLTSFSISINIVKNTIQELVGYTNSLIPIMITLMITTGSISSATVTQPILLLLVTLIGNIISNFILPVLLISTSLNIVSQISDEVKIGKLSKFLNSTTIWILGIIMTLFVTVLSIEGSLTSTVDGVTAKTTKAAVSTIIPVVGKILGDATDAVIGCAGILKNAVGIIGIIVVISICIIPIIKLTIFTLLYYLTAAIAEPIADVKVIKLLSSIGDTFKTLLAIVFCVSVILIVGLTIVIKISNATLLYR